MIFTFTISSGHPVLPSPALHAYRHRVSYPHALPLLSSVTTTRRDPETHPRGTINQFTTESRIFFLSSLNAAITQSVNLPWSGSGATCPGSSAERVRGFRTGDTSCAARGNTRDIRAGSCSSFLHTVRDEWREGDWKLILNFMGWSGEEVVIP